MGWGGTDRLMGVPDYIFFTRGPLQPFTAIR
jgi:hypothetical protein